MLRSGIDDVAPHPREASPDCEAPHHSEDFDDDELPPEGGAGAVAGLNEVLSGVSLNLIEEAKKEISERAMSSSCSGSG